MELDRQKRIVACRFHALPFLERDLFYGTVIYGTWVSQNIFVVEDLYYYKGQKVSMCFEKDKWHLIYILLSNYLNNNNNNNNNCPLSFRIPPMNMASESLPPHLFHHVQIRHLQKQSLYVNYIMKPNEKEKEEPCKEEKTYYKSLKKPQYQALTVFKMKRDPTGNDLYKLYTFGPNKSFIFYDYILVQDIQTSYFLKQMFGEITISFRRNQNLDYMEESDDEGEDEEKEKEKKEEDNKAVWVQCRFDFHFKKWIPCEKVRDFSRVVHISQL